MRVYFAGPLFSDAERLIVGLRTDTRTAFASAALNPMIGQALDQLCHSVEELEATLAAHLTAKTTGSDAPSASGG